MEPFRQVNVREHCGFIHTGVCQRIKAIDYYENGQVKRVEYHGEVPPAQLVQFVFPPQSSPPPRDSTWQGQEPDYPRVTCKN